MDFSQVNNRKGTYSTQWDFTVDRFGRHGVLPFSISDTDFKVPEEIQTALSKLVEKGIFGYSRWNHPDFFHALKYYFETRHQTDITGLQFLYSPSVMYSVSLLIRKLSQEGNSVVAFSPMYDAFYRVIEENNRNLLEVELVKKEGKYEVDFTAFEEAIKDASVFLLCSPHNPTGRVWRRDELEEMVRICQTYQVAIISDEIHSDIILFGNKHTPILDVSQADGIYLVSSASKTFNTASLIGSYVILNNQQVYDAFMKETRHQNFLNSVSLLGMEAMIVGYQESAAYIDDLVNYIEGNFEYTIQRLNEISPKLKLALPEATYLAWIDVSELDITESNLQDLLINKGNVGIMSGINYGDASYLRMNIGCPRSKLEEGLNRVEKALHSKI